MRELIQQEINGACTLLQTICNDEKILTQIEAISNRCIQSLLCGHKILFAGNGGSAADSQHLAAELVSRLRYERQGLAALALTTDSSNLTAIGNDYGFEQIFARQIEALGRRDDIFVAISTSGRSPNILRALEKARAMGLITVGLTGQAGIEMEKYGDYVVRIPSLDTQKIQECHIVLGHIICGLIENAICANSQPKEISHLMP